MKILMIINYGTNNWFLWKKKKIRETNWKETIENDKRFNTLSNETYTRLNFHSPNSARNNKGEEPKETKDRAIRIYSRRIKARNNQRSSIVKIRRIEEQEIRNEKLSEWIYRAEGKQERVMDKKKEALDRVLTEKGNQRIKIHKRSEQREKQIEDKTAIEKIAQDIEQFFRSQVTDQNKTKNLQNRSDKARTFSDFKLRKTFFASRFEDQDRNFEDSRNASPL